MNDKILLKLLQLQFEHNRKIEEFAGKINLNYFELDLLSVVLDALEVPADNVIEQIEQYGYNEWLIQPGTFSRNWYYEEFERRVREGSPEEYQAYLEAIRAVHQPYFSLEPLLAEMV